VKFSDIGEFIDQPVKTYSSGMYVRLAFAVIVHVKADILVIDEALSVGDMYFQAKCMAHLHRLIEEGITILFVSHDVNAVKALCNRAIYLEQGKLVSWGGTQEVVNAYFGSSIQNQQTLTGKVDSALVEVDSLSDAYRVSDEFLQRANFQRLQNGMAEYLNVVLLDQSGLEIKLVDHDQLVTLRMVIRTNVDIPYIATGYHIRDKSGFDVVYSDTCFEGLDITGCKSGEVFILDWKFNISLAAGDYSIATMLSIPRNIEFADVEVCDFVPLAVQVQVGRGGKLPLHGAVHWANCLDIKRSVNFLAKDSPL
jgi:lipopolysaccharide transport system ATP-binding protein